VCDQRFVQFPVEKELLAKQHIQLIKGCVLINCATFFQRKLVYLSRLFSEQYRKIWRLAQLVERPLTCGRFQVSILYRPQYYLGIETTATKRVQ